MKRLAITVRVWWMVLAATLVQPWAHADDRGASVQTRWLNAEIDTMVADGRLNPYAVFSSADEAAMAVLEHIVPLAEQAGREVGGRVFPEANGWSYTLPHVGDEATVQVPYGLPAYHTHPGKRVLRFSNNSCAWDGGQGDVGWVQASGSPLYLGVVSSHGDVLVGVCDPGFCGHRQGATQPSRILRNTGADSSDGTEGVSAGGR